MINYWIAGIYPRNAKLIESTRLYDKTLKEQFKKEKSRLLRIQLNNKLDYISDPLIDWDDNLRPFTDNLRGIERGPLTRYYENNTFYRQPIIKSKLSTTGNILKNSICFDLFTSKSKVKIDILDPFTLYDLSANEFYKSEEEAVNAFVEMSKLEGIIPALETSHAIAEAIKRAQELGDKKSIVVTLSGRGDKDTPIIAKHLGNNL